MEVLLNVFQAAGHAALMYLGGMSCIAILSWYDHRPRKPGSLWSCPICQPKVRELVRAAAACEKACREAHGPSDEGHSVGSLPNGQKNAREHGCHAYHGYH
jgi:hypothetical protein